MAKTVFHSSIEGAQHGGETLDEFVNFFVIVESTCDHQGNIKELNLNLEKFKKFKKKIIYIVVDDTIESIKKKHKWGESLVEQHQRNSIMRGLKKASDEDLIILSDVDEIPDLTRLNSFNKKSKYAVFSQKMFNFKLNLLNEYENNWHGSKMCLKKDLKSPQWLRNLEFKKYPFWRIDKEKSIQLIENGGWHFNYLLEPEKISKKLKTFAHTEYNKDKFTNISAIKNNINEMRDLFNKGYKYYKVQLDNTFPDYILNNKSKFNQWIKQ